MHSPLPRELRLHIAARLERLAGLDDEEVLGVNFAVLGHIEVFLRDEHALTEEVLVDLLAARFGDEPVVTLVHCILNHLAECVLT